MSSRTAFLNRRFFVLLGNGCMDRKVSLKIGEFLTLVHNLAFDNFSSCSDYGGYDRRGGGGGYKEEVYSRQLPPRDDPLYDRR